MIGITCLGRIAMLGIGGLAGLCLTPTAVAADPPTEPAPAKGRPVDFAAEVFPILEQRCHACHGEAQQLGEFRLDAKAVALGGGATGPAIIPGESTNSPLVLRIEHAEGVNPMPIGSPKLSDNEIALIRTWIDQGAVWPDEVGEADAEVNRHWAYVRPRRPTPPETGSTWARNAIDRFVFAKLQEKDLLPNTEAPRETLIRRLSLDLTGLPPTEDEVAAFVSDTRSDAYERLVDRLLASQHYGEHWASAWLDLARYADTNGYESDEPRSIWLYRDWVVDAFNRNIGFDRFTVEQLAGDMLADATEQQKIATGFHRNTLVNNEAGSKNDEFYDAAVKDRVDTTATVWLASTIGCAQCHNHKYDPFTQREYYSLYSIFDNTTDSAIELSDELEVFRGDDDELSRREAEVRRLDEILRTPTPQLEAEQQSWEQSFRTLQDSLDDGWRSTRLIAAGKEEGAEPAPAADGTVTIDSDENGSGVFEVLLEGSTDISALRIELAPPDSTRESPIEGAETDKAQDAAPAPIQIRKFELIDHSGSRAESIEAARAKLTFDEWHMIGPFREESRRKAFEKIQGPETDYDLLKLYEDGNLFWMKRSDWRDGVSHALQGENAATFAHRTITAKEPMPLRLLVGAEKDVEVWFNRERIHRARRTKQSASEQEELILRLQQGENHVVIKLANDVGDYSFYFRAYTEPEWESRIRIAEAIGHAGQERALSLPALVNGAVAPGWMLGKDDVAAVGLRLAESTSRSGAGSRLQLRLLLSSDTKRAPARIRVFATHLQGSALTELLRTPERIRDILRTPAAQRTAAVERELAAYYPSIAPSLQDARSRRLETGKELEDFRRRNTVSTLVVNEREEPRETHIQNRGNFLDLGEQVQSGVPKILGPAGAAKDFDRLRLAQWLVDGRNPLTARVRVNQIWAGLFGRGLVATPEDFGTQGDRPSHPQLLDWLSTEFVRLGWDQKALLKELVTSAAYRQSSAVTDEKLEKDPNNEWLSRGARFRLRGEAIRDVALKISGLLSDKLGGPGVFPPQPASVLNDRFIEGGFRLWQTSEGDDRYRRALYTFYKRTAVYPMLSTFDASDRTICAVRRPRSNTPLQALNTLNDPAFFEAAGGFAQRIVDRAATPADRVEYAFLRALARRPDEREAESMLRRYEEWRAYYQRHTDQAVAAVNAAFHDSPPAQDPTDLAPWVLVANVMLNLDETVTRE